MTNDSKVAQHYKRQTIVKRDPNNSISDEVYHVSVTLSQFSVGESCIPFHLILDYYLRDTAFWISTLVRNFVLKWGHDSYATQFA